jgi:predicted RNA-binding protein YlxR (DUF448 family)
MPQRRPLLLRATPPGRRSTADTADARLTGAVAPVEAGEGDEQERGPLRRCVVTRERLPKERMIRFVLGPDRTVVPDVAARLPGRGIWLSARGDVIETARARGGFARAARGVVIVPPDLSLQVQAALARRIGEFLGLARRAGQAVCGFQKAREWLISGRAGLVVQASDGSAEERARFLGGDRRVKAVAPLPAAPLGAVFGRDRAVHVAVAPGRLAEAIAVDAERLAGFSGRNDGFERAGA